MTDAVLLHQDGGVATLTLNRPDKLNAFTDEMLASLAAHLKGLGRDDSVRCVVLTGAGRGFSAGQDLSGVRDRADAGGMNFRQHLEHDGSSGRIHARETWRRWNVS